MSPFDLEITQVYMENMPVWVAHFGRYIHSHIVTQGIHKCAIAGIPGKHAWYHESQMKRLPWLHRLWRVL